MALLLFGKILAETNLSGLAQPDQLGAGLDHLRQRRKNRL